MPGADLVLVDRVSAELNRLAARAGWPTQLLHTITSIDDFGLEPRACLFALEGETVELVAQIGEDEVFRRLHESLRRGDCLCGAAARNGHLVTSLCCEIGCRHTLEVPDGDPNGHIVVPLKAAGQLAGALCLYLPPERQVGPSMLMTLTLIGEQIGLALHNASLRQQLETDRLRDPVLDLPSERMLRILGEQQLAEALRYKRPLSLISAVPTSDKPAGHEAQLAPLATLIDQQTRRVDVVACCGPPPSDVIALLPHTALQDASVACERLQRTARAAGVTVAIGVASTETGIGSLDELMARARAERVESHRAR